MPFDITTIAPEARNEYIRIGRSYSSAVTLAQINKHLSALQKYGAELVQHGFSVADGQQATDARDALEAESSGRAGIQGVDQATTQAHHDALAAGRQERENGRGVLGATARTLRQAGGDANVATATTIDGALRKTRISPRFDGEKLVDQLEVLRSTLALPAVAAAAADRGGPEAVAALTQTAARLRASNKAIAGRGTLSATERMDLLEGLLVTLARSARKAAVAAAKRLGQPAVAGEFALSDLKKGRSSATTPAQKKEAKAAAATAAATTAATATAAAGARVAGAGEGAGEPASA